MDELHVLRIMLNALPQEKRWRETQTTRWKDSCKRCMESVELKKEDVLERANWKNYIHNYSGDPEDHRWEKPEGKKKWRLCER